MIDPNRRARPLTLVAAALTVVIAAAGGASAQSPSPAASTTPATSPAVSSVPASASPAPLIPVALLLPDTTDPRWESVDAPAFEAKLTEVCPTAVLDSRNAGGDAALQAQQAEEALNAGATVLVVDPVDAVTGAAIVGNARAAGAQVISYDTAVSGAAPDYHIAYDPAVSGFLVSEAVITTNLEAASLASPEPTEAPGGVRVVLISGPQDDPDVAAWATKVKEGLAVEGTVVHEAVATALTAEEGQRIITEAIAAVGADAFDSVVTSDDALAAGVIAGLGAADIVPATRLVTGGNASVSGVQQVLIDNQLLTTFEPPTPQAQLAAVVACGLATGHGLPEGLTTTPLDNGTADIPSLLLSGVVVTGDGSVAGTRSVADTIIAGQAFGAGSAALICTADYLTACEANDITLPVASPSPASSAAASPVASVAASQTPAVAPSAAPSAAP